MYSRNLDNLNGEESMESKDIDNSFESSFAYPAIPLDEQMTLDENGIPFSLQELMDIKELRDFSDNNA